MSPSGPEVIKQIREQVDEVDPADVRRQLGNGAVLVDVRETEEFAAGHIPGAKHVPRGYLESRIETAVPDHDAHACGGSAAGSGLAGDGEVQGSRHLPIRPQVAF